jgi:uncharacterized protein (TIGR02246 family)
MRLTSVLAVLLPLALACRTTRNAGSSAAEFADLRSVNEAYRAAWLEGDSAAVLRLFTSSAVLLPHHGDPPVVGIEAIRHFWWPEDAPLTTVTRLDITTDGAQIDGQIGTLWGRFSLAFSYRDGGQTRSVHNGGTYLMVLKRQSDQQWRITHRMWGDPIPQLR